MAITRAKTAVEAAEAGTTSLAQSYAVAGRSGDGAAGLRVAELFERHGATVLGLCRAMLRNVHEAEDAVQQTFLAAYRSLLNGNEPRHPAAWLATIARNECLDVIRHRMREPLPDHEIESALPDPVASAAARADLIELWKAVRELPRQQRRALLLREFSGLSYDELAQALDVSEPAVESLLFRARSHVRLRLRATRGTAASVAPLAAIREALARVVVGMPGPGSASGVVKLASLPLAAKLAAGAATVVVAGGTVAAVETRTGHHRPSQPSPDAAVHVALPAPPPRRLPAAPAAASTVRPHAPVKAAPTITSVVSAAAPAPAVLRETTRPRTGGGGSEPSHPVAPPRSGSSDTVRQVAPAPEAPAVPPPTHQPGTPTTPAGTLPAGGSGDSGDQGPVGGDAEHGGSGAGDDSASTDGTSEAEQVAGSSSEPAEEADSGSTGSGAEGRGSDQSGSGSGSEDGGSDQSASASTSGSGGSGSDRSADKTDPIVKAPEVSSGEQPSDASD